MGKKLNTVDEYIDQSADFARPILRKLRNLFHKADPRITESLKWGFPHFEHKGIVGSMAAFKHYVSTGFWKGGLMEDPAGLFQKGRNTRVSALKMRSLDEVPPEKVLLVYIRSAVDLNEKGIKIPTRKVRKMELVIPDFFVKALEQNKKAKAAFEAFSKGHQREYVEWLAEAKRDATRQRRLETTLQWLKDSKPRNWKYTK